ncbi:hypothetical protein GCM10027614_54880 [Micromonospora vulcania]
MTRWGILATGHIASRFAEDLRLVPDAELVAVGSRAVESAQRFADTYGAKRAYGSWVELAADPEVDAIYVATPHSAHHEAAMTCLTAGRPVLLEKPFTLDLASSTELVDTARAAEVFLMEAMWMRTNPLILRAAELVAQGAIGTVSSVRADFGVAGPFPPEHRMRNAALGGGALLDLGCTRSAWPICCSARRSTSGPGHSSARRGRTRTPAFCSATTTARWPP